MVEQPLQEQDLAVVVVEVQAQLVQTQEHQVMHQMVLAVMVVMEQHLLTQVHL
jgi:hypothetical protein